MAAKKKTVKKSPSPKTASTQSPDDPAAGKTAVVDPSTVPVVTMGRAGLKYLPLAKQVAALPKGKALVWSPDVKPKSMTNFRSSLIASLENTIERHGLGIEVSIKTLADRSGFLITRG